MSSTDEGGQMTPAAFRAALASALGVQPVRVLAAVASRTLPEKGDTRYGEVLMHDRP